MTIKKSMRIKLEKKLKGKKKLKTETQEVIVCSFIIIIRISVWEKKSSIFFFWKHYFVYKLFA
jgi:hypothetical protein